MRVGPVRVKARQSAGPGRCGRGRQVERFGKSALEGPRIFIAPDVFSHDKNAHTAVAVRTIVHPSNIMVHPAEDELIIIDGCGGSEVAFAGARFLLASVRPRPDDSACARILFAAASREETVEICRRTI